MSGEVREVYVTLPRTPNGSLREVYESPIQVRYLPLPDRTRFVASQCKTGRAYHYNRDPQL